MTPDQQYLKMLEAQHEQCWRAFKQAPCPRLGAALKQIEAQMKYRRRCIAKEGQQ